MSDALDAIRAHPRLVGVGRTEREQERLGDFARDVAGWLYGEPAESMGPLARVVVRVARRELADPLRLCQGRALLAVEAGARAAQVLWPWVRDTFPDAPEDTNGAENPGGDAQADAEPDADADAQADADADASVAAGFQPAEPPTDPPATGDGGGPHPPNATETDFAAMEAALRAALGGEPLSTAASEACGGALEAERVARHLERFLPGIGWSSAPGQLDHALLERLDGFSSLLQRLPALQDLADRLGRLEDANRRAGDRIGGGEEVAGVHFGGEVALALPAELALLGDPDTEDLFYQRLLERRLLSLELTGRGMDGTAQADRRGPVIAAIDTSGSMQGAPELAAKALVLAVCRRVLPQNRTVHLLLFGGVGEHTEIRLKRGLGGLEGLIDFLSLAFEAGTDFDTPLLRALELLEERDLQKADLLVVTDGLCRAGAEIVEQVAVARARRGVRVLSIVLGRHGTDGVDPFSDEVWQLDPTDPTAAVGFFRSLTANR